MPEPGHFPAGEILKFFQTLGGTFWVRFCVGLNKQSSLEGVQMIQQVSKQTTHHLPPPIYNPANQSTRSNKQHRLWCVFAYHLEHQIACSAFFFGFRGGKPKNINVQPRRRAANFCITGGNPTICSNLQCVCVRARVHTRVCARVCARSPIHICTFLCAHYGGHNLDRRSKDKTKKPT